MAQAQLKFSESGWSFWVVAYPDGSTERVHNRATAITLAHNFNSQGGDK